MSRNAEPRSERIDIRATPSAKRALLDAANASRKTVSEFLLDSGLEKAAEIMAERRLFLLDDEQWAAFLAALDAPRSRCHDWRACSRNPAPWRKHCEQGHGWGGSLLKDALRRTAQAADIAGIRALFGHAKDEGARAFYEGSSGDSILN